MTGRIRTVKPEWLEDELLAAASDEARVLSIALILGSDDYGIGRAHNATLATLAWRFAMERDDGAHAPEVLARASRAFRELVAMRFVGVWKVDGQSYFAIRNWDKHQRVDKPSKRRLPVPPPGLFEEIRQPPEGSRDPREPLATTPENTRARSGPPTSDLDQDHRPGPGARPSGARDDRPLGDLACSAWTRVLAERGRPFQPDPSRDAARFRAIGQLVNATRGAAPLDEALAGAARRHLDGRRTGSTPEYWLEWLNREASSGHRGVSPASDFVPSPVPGKDYVA